MAMGACSGCGHHKNLYGEYCAECIGDGRHHSHGRYGERHQRRTTASTRAPCPGCITSSTT